MTRKVAIVVGHNDQEPGAVRCTDGVPEYDWNLPLARMIQSLDPENIAVFTREDVGGYSREIEEVYRRVDEWGADVSVELHFNAATPRASGTEVLSSGTDGSLDLCHRLQVAMVNALELPDRGMKVRGRHDRGGLSLWSGRAPAALIEPFYGSNPSDVAVADDRFEDLARAIYDGTR